MNQGTINLLAGDNLNVDFGTLDFVKLVFPAGPCRILSAVARPDQPRVSIYCGSLGTGVPYSYVVFKHGPIGLPPGVPRANLITCPGYKDLGVLSDNSIQEMIYDTAVQSWRPVLAFLAAIG